jgi:Uma2 family endonuclease
MVAASKFEEPMRMTEAEYLAFEEKSEIKHEFVNGKVFAMTGAKWNHIAICANIGKLLNNQLDVNKCLAVSTELRLKVTAKKAYRYPDIMVVCGGPHFVDKRKDTIDNPIVIAEILSPSTAVIDRNDKFHEYLQLASLQEYLIVSQNEPQIERYLRQESGEWLYKQVTGMDAILELPSIECKLALEDVYVQVLFDEADTE